MRTPTSMCASLTHMLLPTGTSSYLIAIRNMSLSKRESMSNRLERWSMSLTPLVLVATAGITNGAAYFYKRLALLLARKWDLSYSSTCVGYVVFCRFSLLHSAIQCSREARSSYGHACKSSPAIDLVSSESRLDNI